MENGFRFEIGIGASSEPLDRIWVEIPTTLYNKVCSSIGENMIEQMDFCYHFQERAERDFPELDQAVKSAIKDWEQTNVLGNAYRNMIKVYSLFSPWFG